MDTLPKDKIFKYNENTLHEVRKNIGLDKPNAMKDAVEILEQWAKQQKHFTKKNFDRRYLETAIVTSKGSLERSKSKLDRSCTVRTLLPQYFQNHDLRLLYKTDLKHIIQIVLPNMTKGNERVAILRNNGRKFENTMMFSYLKGIISLAEYTRRNDYATSYLFVLDYTDVNLSELVKVFSMSSTYIQHIVTVLLECCGFRLKGVYFISSSKLIDMAVSVCKQVLSEKLGGRLHVLKNIDELKNIVEIDILPKEYGGKENTLEELQEQWLDVLTSKEHTAYMEEINSARTDESLRQTDTFNDQYMGMPGTFRTIRVD